MPGPEVWGNAAAVPLIVAVTQFLKQHFKFKRKSDVIALAVSLIVCFGWDFYKAPLPELHKIWGGDIFILIKHIIQLLLVSFATWLSAGKSYDFFVGESKRKCKINSHLEENEELKKQIEALLNEKNMLSQKTTQENSSEET